MILCLGSVLIPPADLLEGLRLTELGKFKPLCVPSWICAVQLDSWGHVETFNDRYFRKPV